MLQIDLKENDDKPVISEDSIGDSASDKKSTTPDKKSPNANTSKVSKKDLRKDDVKKDDEKKKDPDLESEPDDPVIKDLFSGGNQILVNK